VANETNIYFFSSVHGFERINVSADEDSLDEMVTVRLYLKGNASLDQDPPQCQNFIFNIICRDISTGEIERMYVICVYYTSICISGRFLALHELYVTLYNLTLSSSQVGQVWSDHFSYWLVSSSV